MNLLKENLSMHKWTFDLLVDEVRSNFAQRLQVVSTGPLSITYLAHNFYNKNAPKLTLEKERDLNLKALSILDSEVELMNQYLNKYFKQGTLETNPEKIQTIESLLLEFSQIAESDESLKSTMCFFEKIILVKDVTFRGASHPHFLGTLFLSLPDDFDKKDVFTSIVHELAHQELFLFNFLDRLVNKNYDYHLIHAPYQNKMRPPIGRLHSLHALYRMIQFNKQDVYTKKFKENIQSFEEDELTDFSKFLLNDVYRKYEEVI